MCSVARSRLYSAGTIVTLATTVLSRQECCQNKNFSVNDARYLESHHLSCNSTLNSLKISELENETFPLSLLKPLHVRAEILLSHVR